MGVWVLGWAGGGGGAGRGRGGGGGGQIFLSCLDRPWAPPSLLYNGYRFFPGGKVAGAWR